MESRGKTRKRASLEDVAQALGRDPREVVETLRRIEAERGEAPKEEQEGAEEGDYWVEEAEEAARVQQGAASAAAPQSAPPGQLASQGQEEMRRMKHRMDVAEGVMQDMARDLYGNTIRIEVARDTKLRDYHSQMMPVIKKLVKRQDIVVQVRSNTFHHDVVVRELLDAKSTTELVRKELVAGGLQGKAFVVPPVNPWANIYKGPCSLAYKTLMAEIETVREDADSRLPAEYKCRTQRPVPEADAAEWSMGWNGTTFMKCSYDKRQAVATITMFDRMRIHDVDVTANSFLSSLRAAWRYTWRIETRVVPRASGAIARAPDSKEVRQAKRASRA